LVRPCLGALTVRHLAKMRSQSRQKIMIRLSSDVFFLDF
jgi:hypothetical protein